MTNPATILDLIAGKAKPLTRAQAIWRGELVEIDMGVSQSRKVFLHMAMTSAAWDTTVGEDDKWLDCENPRLLCIIDTVRRAMIFHPELRPGADAIKFPSTTLAGEPVALNLYVGWGDHGQSEDPVITISLAEED